MSWLGKAIQANMDERQRAVDAEILSVILNPPPDRIIRSEVVERGGAWDLPGTQFADGLPRLIVRPDQRLALETLERYGMLDA